MDLKYKTEGLTSPEGKPNVYFCCHPNAFEKVFDSTRGELLYAENSLAIWYYDPSDGKFDRERLREQFDRMQLFVVYVTKDFLFSENDARTFEFAYALQHRIPILPIINDPDLVNPFYSICGTMDYISKTEAERDKTKLPYITQLTEFLKRVVIGDELIKRIENEFACSIFLSYRKKDRQQALKLMKTIHEDAVLREAAIWFDDFLVPGEDFNEAIRDKITKSDLFLMSVTPSLLEKGNYVADEEYPAAKRLNKDILAVEMVPTDIDDLAAEFRGLEKPIIIDDAERIVEMITDKLLDKIRGRTVITPEHLYLLGMAYFTGTCTEVNREIGYTYLYISAENDYIPAIRKMMDVYALGDGVRRDPEAALTWHAKLMSLLDAELTNEKTPEKYSEICKEYISFINTLFATNKHEAAVLASLTLGKYAREMIGNDNKDGNRYLAASQFYIADYYYKTDNLSRAMELYESAVSVGEKAMTDGGNIGDALNLAVYCDRLGNYYRQQKDYRKAEEWFVKALELRQILAKTGGYEELQSLYISLNKLGLVCKDNEEYEDAREWFESAYILSTKVMNATNRSDVAHEAASITNNLGMMHMYLREFKKAEMRIIESLKIYNMLLSATRSADSMEGIIRGCINYSMIPTVDTPVRQNHINAALAFCEQFKGILGEKKYNFYVGSATNIKNSLG